MSVYVDGAQNAFGRMKMCHMLADTYEELIAMADKIGVQRKWYQGLAKASSPHFDIAQSKRALAVARGAIEIDRYKLVEIMKRNKVNEKEWPRHAES
jgi:Protein of unknown function (DUF4031)